MQQKTINNPLRAFYKENKPDLSGIRFPKFRHYRFRLRNGKFLKIKKTARSEAELQKLLVRYAPLDAFYSVSKWLNPGKLGPRGEKEESVFLSSNLVFDLDTKPFSRWKMEECRRETLKLVEFLEKKGIKISYVAFSGGKGFHVVCEGKKSSAMQPREREKKALAFAKKIASEVKEKGIEIDSKVTTDTRRVIRIPGTLNSSTGFACTLVSRKELEQPFRKMLKKFLEKRILVSGISARKNDAISSKLPCTIKGRASRAETRLAPPHYATFVSSTVQGMPRTILFLEFPPDLPEKKLVEKIKCLQETYDLPDFYVFQSDSSITAVCLKTLDLRRAEKIAKASNCLNWNSVFKHKQFFFRVGESKDDSGETVEEPPKFLKKIPSKFGKTSYKSKGHSNFFRKQGVKINGKQREHGKDFVTLTHAAIS
jgi:DNA primase catalytic subunit